MKMRGSYAGAMGIPQFLPSSFRRYAVDFDSDGKRDLMSVADAIGSVANYYREFGWQTGATVLVPVTVTGADAEGLLKAGIKPHLKVSELRRLGVIPAGPVDEA